MLAALVSRFDGEGPQMRRVVSRTIVGAVLAGIAMLAVSACATAPGITSRWPAMSEPTGWEPKAGACFTEFLVQAHRAAYKPIDCGTEHRYETVAVELFSGAAAQLPSPPAANSPEMKAAWADCDAKTTEFLGGEWRNGKIWIGVSLPSNDNWSGGARWYTCQVAPLEDFWDHAISTTQKSLKGEFAGESTLKFGCYQQEKGSEPRVDKSCTEPHNSEYTGFVKVAYAYDDLKNHTDEFFSKCRSNIAQYAVRNSSVTRYLCGA